MAGKMDKFKWTKRRIELAETIADGNSVKNAAKICDISERTAYRWNSNLEFSTEVDRLTLMMGIASKAKRLRIAKKVVREKMAGGVNTKKDLLEWMQFAAKETDEVRLNLADIIGSMLIAKREDIESVSGKSIENFPLITKK
jgi:transposase